MNVRKALPEAAAIGIACAVTLTAIFWPSLPAVSLWLGAGVLLTQTVFSIILNQTWFARLNTDAGYKRGLMFIEVQAIINGTAWFFLLVGCFYATTADAESLQFFPLVCAIVMGCSAGAINILPSFMPAMLWFIIPANLSGTTLIIIGNDTDQRLVGVVFILFMIINCVMAYRRSESFREAAEIRYHNAALLEAYRDQKEIAEGSSRAKARFLAAASHDLRQPIHAIGLLVDTLESQAKSPDTKVLGQSIGESVDDLTSLLDVILDISKIDAGLIQSNPGSVPVAKILASLHKRYAQTALDKGLEFRVRFTDAIAHCDQALLDRILGNLVSNAIKYTHDGGVVIGVRRRKNKKLLIQVWDTGVGIPPEAVKEVFLEYYQIGNLARAETEGLGLGLSIVKGLCTALDYNLGVRSELHQGSVFSVLVPEADVAAYSMPLGEQALKNEGNARVLLIDDDKRVLGATNQLLCSHGYDVRVAESSDEAIKRIAGGFVPDVVFCDYRLDEPLNGSQVLDLIRERFGEQIRGVLITADTDPARLREAKRSGYLLRHKPLSAYALRETLVRVDESRDDADSLRRHA